MALLFSSTLWLANHGLLATRRPSSTHARDGPGDGGRSADRSPGPPPLPPTVWHLFDASERHTPRSEATAATRRWSGSSQTSHGAPQRSPTTGPACRPTGRCHRLEGLRAAAGR